MRVRREDARPGLERAVVAASLARSAHHTDAFDRLRLVHRELAAEVARLAIRTEERLTPRSHG